MKDGAVALQRIGLLCLAGGTVFLALVAAYPLGLVRAYPLPPESYRDGPFGLKREISDVKELYRRDSEENEEYFVRLSKSIYKGIVHYWHAGDAWEESDMRYTRISPWDNYLIWLLSFRSNRERLRAIEFMTPEKAIRRGYGFCSQMSRIAYTVLKRQGYDPRILFHEGHVIVEVDGMLIDPAYGVVLPQDRNEAAESAAELVPVYYEGFESAFPHLIEIFSDGWDDLGERAQVFERGIRWEARFELLKWIPPLFLSALGAATLLFSGRARTPKAA